MLDYITYKYKVWRLQNSLDKNEKWYARERKKAKQRGESAEEIGSLVSEEMHFETEIQVDLMLARTRYIRRVAAKLFIPEPPFDPKAGTDWTYAEDDSRRAHLTLDGQRRLEAQIRQEKAARSERLLRWMPQIIGMVTALTGVMGAAIGLISILHGKAK